MEKNKRRLSHLTSIRGIAAWWVVLFHSQALLDIAIFAPVMNIIGHGYLAVDLFFILSGFVIYFNYHSKVISGFPRSAIAFYLNRFSRIYPLHLVMLGGYVLLAAAFFYFSKSGALPNSYSAKSFMESIFLIHAWHGSEMSWNVPSWSISAEWFVYLLFPLMAMVLQKYLINFVTHIVASALILLSIYCVYSVLQIDSLGGEILTMALLRTFTEFLLGAIIGSLYLRHHAYLVKYRYWFLFTMASALFFYINFNIKDFVVMPTIFFLLILFMCVDNGFMQSTLSNKVLVYLGEISYSTYMVHYFVYDLLKARWVTNTGSVNQIYLLLSFLSVLALSILAHHLIEIPSQKYLRNKLTTSKQ